jgi:hypothetical protein
VYSAQGVSPQFPVGCGARRVLGARCSVLDSPRPGSPPRVRNSQVPSNVTTKSTEHVQLGWVVGRPSSVGSLVVLSTPPGHPTAGRCVATCRASISLAPLYSPCCASSAFGLRLGVKAPLPLRASSRGPRVLPGALNALPVSSAFHPRLSLVAYSSSSRQNEIGSFVVPAGRSADVVEPHYAL